MASLVDYSCYAKGRNDQRLSVYFQIDGMRCAACAWKIESALNAHEGVEAHINYSTERLKISWPNAPQAEKHANDFAAEIEDLGFHVAPFDIEQKQKGEKEEERFLLRCLAVAGFATGNIMLFSQALWFAPAGDLAGATRDLMHWVMALIALPATIYAGRPFFYSAYNALSHGRTNMDVPISLAVILANALSIFETYRHGHYVYFDASVMLLFFLLIGRFLDIKARGKAREAAEGLLAMLEGTAKIIKDGVVMSLRIRDLVPGQVLLTAAGEKIAADGIVTKGSSEVDTSLVTGETLPRPAIIGTKLYAGMINQSAPLEIEISAASDQSLLSEIVSLMEKAEQSASQYVRIADRVARLYAPVVHVLAFTTLVGWLAYGHFYAPHMPWEDALLKAMAVLIITCPCALGLAVPVVQVLASSKLFKQGILLKSGKGLETLAKVDTVVFDKTGTLTQGQPVWINTEALSAGDRLLAVSMAQQSQHPLSQAVSRAGLASCCATKAPLIVEDIAGQGLKSSYEGHDIWLGKGAWIGAPASKDSQMELWFKRENADPIRLIFEDALREDAIEVVAKLKSKGLRVLILSGDREIAAKAMGDKLGLDESYGALTPQKKVEFIQNLTASGAKVLMLGDGLNDAAALSYAFVSMSPSTGVDITQNAADIIYRGARLSPVITAIDTARQANSLVQQNFALSMIYNVLAIPAAIFGFVTPLIAALAMSGSSLIVIANSFRLNLKSKGV